MQADSASIGLLTFFATSQPEADESASADRHNEQSAANPNVCWMRNDVRHSTLAGESAANGVELPILHIRENEQQHVTNERPAKAVNDCDPRVRSRRGIIIG